MVIDGNRLILIIGKKILFKKNSKSELSPKKIRQIWSGSSVLWIFGMVSHS